MTSAKTPKAIRVAREAWHILGRGVRRDLHYYRMRPTNLLPFLTYRCTSHCRTCSMWQREVTRPELSLAEWQTFFHSLQDPRLSSLRHVEFFGGDVLLRPDTLVPLIEQASTIGLDTAVPVNGILLDAAMAVRLVASGVRTVYISVDGVGEVHDRVRGVAGNFDRICRAVGALREARGDAPSPRLVAICTVSRLNADSFEQVLPFAADMGFDEVQFEYAGEFPSQASAQSVIAGRRPSPYFANPDGSILLDAQQAARVKARLAEMRSSRTGHSLLVVTKNMDFLTTEQMVRGIFGGRRCYMARLQVNIDPYGEVLACPFFDTYYLGNILDQPLSEIWGGPAHRRFLQAQSQGQLPICSHCILSVERNPTLWQTMVKRYLIWARTARA